MTRSSKLETTSETSSNQTSPLFNALPLPGFHARCCVGVIGSPTRNFNLRRLAPIIGGRDYSRTAKAASIRTLQNEAVDIFGRGRTLGQFQSMTTANKITILRIL